MFDQKHLYELFNFNVFHFELYHGGFFGSFFFLFRYFNFAIPGVTNRFVMGVQGNIGVTLNSGVTIVGRGYHITGHLGLVGTI